MQYLSLILTYLGRGIMSDSKEEAGCDAMGEFFHQFGPLDDIYVRILFEVLLEELYGINSQENENEKTN